MANRGFEVVSEAERKNFDEYVIRGEKKKDYDEIIEPAREHEESSYYKIFMPYTIVVPPRQSIKVYTDLRAYMHKHETLIVTGSGQEGLVLQEGIQIITGKLSDNIVLNILNTTGQGIEIEKGDVIGRGLFVAYLTTDNDIQLSRVG